MNRTWLGLNRFVVVVIVCLMASGCATTKSSTSAKGTGEPAAPLDTQASAARLHEIAGSVLLYHVKHGRLPVRLTELTDDASLDCPPLLSPDTGKAYVYHNPPLPLLGRPGVLLIHDPSVYGPASRSFGEPVHWALLVDDESAVGTLGTQVIFVAAREIKAAESKR